MQMVNRRDRDDGDFGLIAEQLGYQLRRVDLLSMGILSERLSQLGVTPARATALIFIALHEGCDQAALARAVDINRASAMAVVNDLVALGAVERCAGRDRRSNALHVTDAGKRLRREIEDTVVESETKFFECLSPSEAEAFWSALRKLRSANARRVPLIDPSTKVALRRVK
jgi:DNA-binding MarR family transcriptional regulator